MSKPQSHTTEVQSYSNRKGEGIMRHGIAAAIAMAAILALAGPNAQAALIAHYTFDGSNANDVTGNGNNGTLNATPTFVTDVAPVPGGSSHAISFNNGGTTNDDYVDLPEGDGPDDPDTDADLFINGSLTVAAWIKIEARSGVDEIGAASMVTSQQTESPWQQNYNLRVYYAGHPESNKVNFTIRDIGETKVSLDDPVVPDLNEWIHYAATFDSTDGATKLFRNGEEIVSDTFTGTAGFNAADLTASLADGGLAPGKGFNDSNFNGLLDDVRIYDEALSQPEIQDLAIPEPASFMVLLLGGLAVIGRRRTRQVSTGAKNAALSVTVLVLVGILALTGPSARAALIVEDSYNIGTGAGEYTDGSVLDGHPSDTPTTGGWAGAWTSSTSGNIPTSEQGGLEYTGISGFPIGGTTGSDGHVRSGGTGGNERGIDTDGTLGSASELWMRILWQPNSTLGPEFFNFRRDASGDGRIVIRRTTTLGSPGERNDLAVDSVVGGNDISPDNFDTFPTLSGGDTHLLLFRLTIDRASGVDDTVDLWADPTATSVSGLGTPTASVTANLLDGANDQLSQFDFTGNNVYLLDEFAIGETFNSVTGIPEPASLGLLLLGGVAVLRRRRAGDVRDVRRDVRQ